MDGLIAQVPRLPAHNPGPYQPHPTTQQGAVLWAVGGLILLIVILIIGIKYHVDRDR